jgi:8-oxo-dGTP diphosphatase
MWSIPGGRVEPGEALAEAARREVLEETGLDVGIGELLGRVAIEHGPDVFDVSDFAARVTAQSENAVLVPGDDASDARWVSRGELAELETTPGLVQALEGWGVWD